MRADKKAGSLHLYWIYLASCPYAEDYCWVPYYSDRRLLWYVLRSIRIFAVALPIFPLAAGADKDCERSCAGVCPVY